MSLRSTYLLLYNGGMFAGWLFVASKILRLLAAGDSLSKVFNSTRSVIKILLIVSCLETVHAAVGLVRSPVATTAVQAFVRLFAFFGAMDIGCPDVSRSVFVNQTVGAWTCSEIIRYAFYVCGLLPKAMISEGINKALTWLRYSAFLALYPIGIIGEAGSFYAALPYVTRTGCFSLALPNTWNFSFSYPAFIKFALVAAYPYGSYIMYGYMLSQRRKVLGV